MERFQYDERDYAFGQAMETLRSAMKLTQAGLSTHLGVSRRTIGAWESGSKYPNAEHLKHFLSLAFDQGAFNTGHEADEIRRFWRTAHQKMLLDEAWLATLVATRQENGNSFAAPAPQPQMLQQVQNEPDKPRPLPLQLTPFFGRTTEMTELTWILGDPHCRLLTIVGPGGIGKTRLALEYGATQTANYADGVAFVGLAAVTGFDNIASAIMTALNLYQSGSSDPTKTLLNTLRKKHLLLILDNFEHLLDGADLVAAIISAAPHVTILATSRERLNLQAEWLFHVDGLSYPQEDINIAVEAPDPTNYSALQLFIQRTRQVNPAFTPNEELLKTITAICQHVAGMPLAIELAAANVHLLTLDKIEQELRTGVDILATTLRDVPARHRSLRAVFDQSWNLLSEPERELLSRLSVFRGGCTYEAAEHVAGARRQVLAALVDKSLIRRLAPPQYSVTGGNVSQVTEAPRFVLLEPIREYGWKKLAAQGDVATIHYKHAAYYLALVERLVAQWENPEANKAIERDYNNMRAALGWARDGGDVIVGLRMAIALNRFWDRRGYYNEGQRWLRELLPRAESHTDTNSMRVRFQATHAAAWLAADQHDYARATILYDQSIELRESLGDTHSELDIHPPQARVGRIIGQYDQTISALEAALAKHRAGNTPSTWDSGSIGMTLYELGLAVREQGDYARAHALIEESIALHRSLNDPEGVAIGLLAMSDLARDQADATDIETWALQALDFFRDQQMRWALGFTLTNLALAAYIKHDLSQADALSSEAVSVFRSLNDDANLAEGLITRGHVLRALGKMEVAYTSFTEALRLTLAVGPRLMVVHTLEGLAGLLAQEKVEERGVQFLAAAAVLRRQMDTPRRPLDLVLETEALTNASATLGDIPFAEAWKRGEKLSPETIAAQLADTDFVQGSAVQQGSVPQSQLDTSRDAPPTAPARTQILDWAEALDIPTFRGRDEETAILSRWIVEERCRVVGLLGMAGAGKSAFAANLMYEIAPHFDSVLWRSLRDAPNCGALVDSCLRILNPQSYDSSVPRLEQRISRLLDHLRDQRVLLVLDNLETLMEESLNSDHARPGYEDYSRLLQRIAETDHESCVVFTSREKPQDIVALESNNTRVRTWRLSPLDVATCNQLLAEKHLTGSASERAALIEAYSGNPLALQVVGQTITDLFGGHIGLFLEQGQIIFGSVQDLLDQQFARLSAVEQTVLLWLAILREPTTFDDVLRAIVVPLPRIRLLEAIESLHRYSFIERGDKPASFKLQAVVSEYVTARLTTAISQEIEQRKTQYLTAYSLVYPQSPEHVKRAQLRLLVEPVSAYLRGFFADRSALEQHLTSLLDEISQQKPNAHGYGAENLNALLAHLPVMP